METFLVFEGVLGVGQIALTKQAPSLKIAMDWVMEQVHAYGLELFNQTPMFYDIYRVTEYESRLVIERNSTGWDVCDPNMERIASL